MSELISVPPYFDLLILKLEEKRVNDIGLEYITQGE